MLSQGLSGKGNTSKLTMSYLLKDRLNNVLEISFLEQHEKFVMHKLEKQETDLPPNVFMSRSVSEEPVQALSASLGAEILLKTFCKANEMFSSCCEDQLFPKNFEVPGAFQNYI